MALTANQKKANRLGIKWDEKTTEEDLFNLIKLEEGKLELEKEQERIRKEDEAKLNKATKEAVVVLRNTRGEDMDQKDYFYGGKVKDAAGKETGEIIYAKPWFNRECGMPVEDEDLLGIFDSMFNPAENFLLYKVPRKEIYIVIVPLKRAHTIGHAEDSLPGDFQKHSMSFIMEGSVNIDTFKLKLKRIRDFIRKQD